MPTGGRGHPQPAACLCVGAPSDPRPTKCPPSPGNSAGDGPRPWDRGPCLLPLARPSVPGKPPSLRVPDPRHLPHPAPPLDTHGSRGLPGGTTPQDRCLPPAWRSSSLRGSGRTGPRSGVTSFSWTPRAGVQLGRGQSPSSPPGAGREAARAGSRTWPPWRPARSAFWAEGPGPASCPRGLPADAALAPPRPACSATPPRAPGHTERAGHWRLAAAALGPRGSRLRLACPPRPRFHRLRTVLSVGFASGARSGGARRAPSQGPREGCPLGGGGERPSSGRPAPRGAISWVAGPASGVSERTPAPFSRRRTLIHHPQFVRGGGGALASQGRASQNWNPSLCRTWNLGREHCPPKRRKILLLEDSG